LLQNVRVIAIDQEAKNADGSPKVGRSATLEVNPVDAQKLALAQEVGTLSLVLRKPGEQNNPVVETISMNDLRYNMYGGARYPAPAVVGNFGPPAPVIQKPAPVVVHHVVISKSKTVAPANSRDIEVYHGTKSEQVKVSVGA
jgi:pilus assembly protein CpaB